MDTVPLPGVLAGWDRHSWRSTTAVFVCNDSMKSPIFILSFASISIAHACINGRACACVCAHKHKGIPLNARALLLPQSTEYHICLFTPRFRSLNSINIYIAAEGVGSPSCRGGKLSSDEKGLHSSLPSRRLVCLYAHYPAIPKWRFIPFLLLPLPFLLSGSYHHWLQPTSYVTL